jgi:hypothetical protein
MSTTQLAAWAVTLSELCASWIGVRVICAPVGVLLDGPTPSHEPGDATICESCSR